MTSPTCTKCAKKCVRKCQKILERLDERFDAFDTKLQSVSSIQADLQNRMVSQEQATSALDERVEVLEAKYEDLSRYASQLQTKLLDLEARSRRHNIKIVGIKEDSEKRNPTDFVSKRNFPSPLKVDRAHRSLQPKPAAGDKPRTIMARIHHFQVKELILRLSRTQPMVYKGNKVLIFPDYTNKVMSQRRAFRDVMKALRDGGVKHHLRYPARLHVYWDGEEGTPKVFKDPAAAEAARLRTNPNPNPNVTLRQMVKRR
uniref:Transposase element L1Md-A101/L1Md-A102/L1Md-A2 n=1 Tax=Knipowitschia caucasica TaxID=637954 RepID=A0AAV2MU95_KNICA